MHLKLLQKPNRTNHPRSHSTDTKTRNGKKRSAAPSISPSLPVNFSTILESNSLTSITSNSASNGTTMHQNATNRSKMTHKKHRTHSIDIPPYSTSTCRTPDQSAICFNNSFGGLKFSYEAQSIPAIASASVPSVSTPQSIAIKDSPPSSPNSENGSRKPSTPSTGEAKDFKIFQNGVHVHMLGNQLNPASSVAQKMSDQLHMELEANSIYTSSSLDSASHFVGPLFPGKVQAQVG